MLSHILTWFALTCDFLCFFSSTCLSFNESHISYQLKLVPQTRMCVATGARWRHWHKHIYATDHHWGFAQRWQKSPWCNRHWSITCHFSGFSQAHYCPSGTKSKCDQSNIRSQSHRLCLQEQFFSTELQGYPNNVMRNRRERELKQHNIRQLIQLQLHMNKCISSIKNKDFSRHSTLVPRIHWLHFFLFFLLSMSVMLRSHNTIEPNATDQRKQCNTRHRVAQCWAGNDSGNLQCDWRPSDGSAAEAAAARQVRFSCAGKPV